VPGQTSLTTSGGGAQLVSTDDVLQALEADLLGGVYPVGSQLPSERTLCERLSVSRPALREVLRRLQERGLITVLPGRGSFVRELRPSDGGATAAQVARQGRVTARQLVVTRTMLECEAAGLAAQNATDEDRRSMAAILHAFDATEDLATSAELDVAFHEAVAVASGNPVIQVMFGSIRPLTYGVVLRSLTDRKVRAAGAPLHELTYNAIVAGDAAAARAAMAEHMAVAERHYGPDLDDPLSEVLTRHADLKPRVAKLLREASDVIDGQQLGTVPTPGEMGSQP